ncbi:Transposase for insertion sequence element IS1111A [Flagellimonas maritima]|uniref:Transposase for insertion sequence element IS1111A n=1 Tax=Flagellimonas maritima TaxID=1383885 RepID=A0A2Z4LS08_9FLAO|nr:IS110 family transposase [Allomuricauda aurantiaca]AWX44480.1 Transposase for insertion sequence element IS1111A [Allomuricauda aurantiaca]AWX46179.1 Transposase for insertion sequence element IS1111A [Allomuricauda aurantiaca]AWX46189.1 Transposase for insertion sequence element IS1111A [Allomuricauda aurantiaca]
MKTGHTARPKLFIGIDIHKRSWKVHCATDLSSGRTFSMSPDPEGLREYVERHYPGHEVSTAYEAGCCGYRAHRSFEGYGWCSLVVNPADIFRKGKERHTKTDRIDAQLIARELKDGRLEGIVVPDPEREQLRSLFRRRNDLVKDMRQIKSYIKMQLLYYGIKVPERYDNDNWSHAFRDWLDNLEFAHPTGKEVLESRMRSFRFIDREFRDVSTQLRKWTKKHYKGDYMLLRSIPGIGPIVASGILSELGDLRRFNNIKQLAGYVGLSPGIYQSGDTIRHTGVSMRAHRLIRSYFIEASWQAIRTDPVMQGYYRKHQGKNVKSVIVKVARKLLSRTLAVIKTGIPYEIGVIA